MGATRARRTPAAQLKDLCLAGPRLTLAVAESLTAGHVQAQISAVAGASEYFLGGITAYSIDQKVKHLGVKRAAAVRVDAVSAEVAAQMARGAARLFDSDLAVATTGYAGPVEARGVTEPFAYWAVAHRLSPRRWHVFTGMVVCGADLRRTEVQTCVAGVVLGELAVYLAAWRKRGLDAGPR